MSQNLKINPQTGDYIVVNGRPVEDGTLNTPAYLRLKISRNKWMYAPDTQYGSDFYLYQSRHTASDDVGLLSVAQRALQPLVDSGRATQITIGEMGSARSNFECSAEITQANGQTTTLTFVPVTN